MVLRLILVSKMELRKTVYISARVPRESGIIRHLSLKGTHLVNLLLFNGS